MSEMTPFGPGPEGRFGSGDGGAWTAIDQQAYNAGLEAVSHGADRTAAEQAVYAAAGLPGTAAPVRAPPQVVYDAQGNATLIDADAGRHMPSDSLFHDYGGDLLPDYGGDVGPDGYDPRMNDPAFSWDPMTGTWVRVLAPNPPGWVTHYEPPPSPHGAGAPPLYGTFTGTAPTPPGGFWRQYAARVKRDPLTFVGAGAGLVVRALFPGAGLIWAIAPVAGTLAYELVDEITRGLVYAGRK